MGEVGDAPVADAAVVAPIAPDAAPRAWSPLEPVLRLLSATIVIGAITGAVIGGLGGRVAMRVLFLTSDESVKGLTSDDGFEIGQFTLSDTIGLVIITALIGIVAGLLYLVAHPFVSRFGRAVVPLAAVFYGTLGGAMMVHRDGVDFDVLEPALLAIALFVAICAGFGAAVASLVNRAAAERSWAGTAPRWLLAVPLLLLLFPPFLLVAVPAAAVNGAGAAVDPDRGAWRVVRVAALVVMSGLFVVGAVDLARDTAALT